MAALIYSARKAKRPRNGGRYRIAKRPRSGGRIVIKLNVMLLERRDRKIL